MLEFNFTKTSIRDNKCWVEITVKRLELDYLGIFIDLLGNKRDKVMEKVYLELIPAIIGTSKKVAFYFLPEKEPLLDLEPSYDDSLKGNLKAKIPTSDPEKLMELEKRGTFLLDSLSNFIEKDGKQKLAIIITQNPIWDIKIALSVAQQKDISLNLFTIPQSNELSDLIIPKKKEYGILIWDGDKFNHTKIREKIFGIESRRIKFSVNNGNWGKYLEKDLKEQTIEYNNEANKDEFLIEIKDNESKKQICLFLESISENTSISYYEGNKKISDKLIKEIDIDENLKIWIENLIEAQSKRWDRIFNMLIKSFDTEEYNFECCKKQRKGFKCGECGKINPKFKEIEGELNKNRPRYIVFIIEIQENQQVIKTQFISEDDINRGKQIKIYGNTVEFKPSCWKMVTNDSTISLFGLKGKDKESNEVGLNRGNIYKIMSNDKILGLIVDCH